MPGVEKEERAVSTLVRPSTVRENIGTSHFLLLSREVESWMWRLVLAIRPYRHRCADGRSDWRADGGLQGGFSPCKGLLLRLGGGRGRVGALTGAAAGLCAGTGLFHLSSLCQRGLVHRLQPETFTLTFVKCLRGKRAFSMKLCHYHQVTLLLLFLVT